ncbi:histone deacetylase family protein [Burkholderia cenocepacia]|uniref:histone deacetylase family protein n=1 Tax=Burkholderia cenocepacia TaxID=95486 RepID=UPI00076C9F8F|nr:hypothetical protein [Burkholderia cenocepacia]KWU19104.1 hypothetical protein AS149_12720 [Burkholderia cenocepacia]
MTTVYSHPDIFLHDAHASHVAMESNRIADIYAAVSAVAGVQLQSARKATLAEFERVHDRNYLDVLRAPLGKGEEFRFDRETIVNEYTWDALAYSAGAVCCAVEAALSGAERAAFSVGYAGHHAQAGHASGFCFTNPIAIGAQHALALGAERVAVLDFDTHSGNGTILSLLHEPRVLFAETYQKGFPGAFMPGFTPGNVLRHRCGTAQEFVRSWTALLAKVREFRPSIVLVSAGFDAHRADPLGLIGVDDLDYAWLAAAITAVGAPVVAALEGGYSVKDTARCAALFVAGQHRYATNFAKIPTDDLA